MKTGSTFESSWELYEPMSFIKPQFKSLLVSHGEIDNYVHYHENEVVDEVDEVEDITVDIDVNPENDDDSEDNYTTTEDSDVDSDSAIILTEMKPTQVKKIKISDGYTLTNYESPEDAATDHFFKSLMPFMLQMTNIQKLRVRNTIQNVILHELQNN